MKSYEKKFTQEEINEIFKLSNCKKRRNKLMSIYFYYSTLADKTGKFECSKAQIYKNHIGKKKMSRSMFFELSKIIEDVFYKKSTDDIVDNSLITPKINDKLDEKTDKKLDAEKHHQSVGIKGLEQGCNKDNVFNVLNNYTYTLNTKPSDFVTTQDLIKIANGIMKELKIKSTMVKNMVISKLNNVKNINSVGAVAYITKVISEKKGIAEANREFYYSNINRVKRARNNEMSSTFAKTHTTLKFNNFTAREHYQDSEYMDYLEKQLTGLA